LYAYFLLFSTSFSFEFEGSVNDTVSIRVDGSTHHLTDRIGQQKAPTASVAAQRVWKRIPTNSNEIPICTFVVVLFRRIKWLKPP
jgi:hypothetical protein